MRYEQITDMIDSTVEAITSGGHQGRTARLLHRSGAAFDVRFSCVDGQCSAYMSDGALLTRQRGVRKCYMEAMSLVYNGDLLN